MAKYFKILIVMVTLAYVNCLPMNLEDQSVDAGSDGEEAAEGKEADLSSDGDKETDGDFVDSEDDYKKAVGAPVNPKLYGRKNDIAKLIILLKMIDDGIKLKGGVDQISSGIDLKKEGFQEIFSKPAIEKETLKSGLMKSIEGDQLVLKGMRQSGKALVSLGLDSFFAAAVKKLGNNE